MPWLRPTIRIRLTLLYGGMFSDRRHPAAVDHLSARRAGPAHRQPAAVQDRRLQRPEGLQQRLSGHRRRQPLAERVQRRDQRVHRPPAPGRPGQPAQPLPAGPARPRRHRVRLRLRHGRARAVAAGADHPHRARGGGLGPVPPDRAGRPGRRAEGAGRHLRRHAGAAPARVHGPAALRGERLPRAAHPAGDQPDAARGAPLRPGGAGGAPAARQDPAGHQRAQRAARGGPAAARPQRQPDRGAGPRRPRGGGRPGHRPGRPARRSPGT